MHNIAAISLVGHPSFPGKENHPFVRVLEEMAQNDVGQSTMEEEEGEDDSTKRRAMMALGANIPSLGLSNRPVYAGDDVPSPADGTHNPNTCNFDQFVLKNEKKREDTVEWVVY